MDKQAFIHEVARSTGQAGAVLWSTHAVGRLIIHGIARSDMERALEDCTVIEDYAAGHRPLPDCLVLGWLSKDEPVHAVVGLDEERRRLLVVTVYRPDGERWHGDWKTRR